MSQWAVRGLMMPSMGLGSPHSVNVKRVLWHGKNAARDTYTSTPPHPTTPPKIYTVKINCLRLDILTIFYFIFN